MLTTNEFNRLMKLPKELKLNTISLPIINTKARFEIKSKTTKDEFWLDIDRSNRYEIKSKTQERTNEVLVRLEINSPPHMNPDGTVTSRDHIHIYKEGFGLAWAYDLDSFIPNINKEYYSALFYSFCEYCIIDLGNTNIHQSL